MNRIALAKRLEGLSSVFASHTPFSRDLQAMSYVLNKMSDDKFTTILSGDLTPDALSSEQVDSCMCGKGPVGPMGGPGVPGIPGAPDAEPQVIVIKKDEGEGMPMSLEASEKTAGMYWNKEASKAVVDNLLRDVVGMNKSVCCDTGRHLETEQIPDGSHKGLPEKPSALKPEQTPDIEKSLDSGIVQKSHGKVEKEASIEDLKKKKEEEKKKKALKVLEGKKGKEASDGEKAEQDAEKKEDEALKKVEEAKDKLEEAKKEEVKAEKDEGEKDATSETSSIIDGIELMASMDECELDANEAAELSKLFE